VCVCVCVCVCVSVQVPMQARKACWMYHMGAGDWTLVLCKTNSVLSCWTISLAPGGDRLAWQVITSLLFLFKNKNFEIVFEQRFSISVIHCRHNLYAWNSFVNFFFNVIIVRIFPGIITFLQRNIVSFFFFFTKMICKTWLLLIWMWVIEWTWSFKYIYIEFLVSGPGFIH